MSKNDEMLLKDHLLKKLYDISEYHSDVEYDRKMSLESAMENYCYFADEYNDGYMPELDSKNKISLSDEQIAYMREKYNIYKGDNLER